MTNGDRIRNMTDEEFAKAVQKFRFLLCPTNRSPIKCPTKSCERCWSDWLKQEVESDEL